MTDQYWNCKQHKHHVDRINSVLNKHLIQAMYNLQLNVYLSQCKSFTIKLQCNLPHRNFCSVQFKIQPFRFYLHIYIPILMILIDFTQRQQQIEEKINHIYFNHQISWLNRIQNMDKITIMKMNFVEFRCGTKCSHLFLIKSYFECILKCSMHNLIHAREHIVQSSRWKRWDLSNI